MSESNKKVLRYMSYVLGFGLIFGLTWNALTDENKIEAVNKVEPSVIEKLVVKEVDKTKERMKQDLIHMVWNWESTKTTPDGTKILQVFDPSRDEYPSCIALQTGKAMPTYCTSYMPMGTKVSTIMDKDKEIYGRDVNEHEARDIAEDLNKSQDFFYQCAIKVKGCVWKWTKANEYPEEITTMIKYLREAEGVVIK